MSRINIDVDDSVTLLFLWGAFLITRSVWEHRDKFTLLGKSVALPLLLILSLVPAAALMVFPIMTLPFELLVWLLYPIANLCGKIFLNRD